MRICICDDNKETCLKIEKVLNKFFLYKLKAKKIGLEFTKEIIKCYSGTSLSNLLLQDEYFDLILLDIQLEDMLGFEIANAMRDNMKNRRTQIIYISSEKSYALDLFESKPFDFLIKPITEDSLFKVMDKFLDYYFDLEEDDRFFYYKKNRVLYKEPLRNILYFEGKDRKIIIHFKDKIDEFYGKLSDIKEELDNKLFVQIHKSIIINYLNVKEMRFDSVLMINDEVLYVTRLYKNELQEFLINNDIQRCE